MGKRSRKQRSAAPEAAAPAAAPPRRPRALARDERPKAPWHPFPLVEICTLIGIVLIAVGFFGIQDNRGGVLIVCGLALASLAGLDTAVREHFAGYRSHSTLLGGVPAVLLAGVLFFARAPWPLVVVAGVAAFAGGIVAFRRAFRRRSGGLTFR